MTDGDAAGSDLTLRDVLTAAAEELPDLRRVDMAQTATWAVGPTIFATLDQARAEFRLDPMVAGAALRTPDTEPSTHGPDWVAFAPPTLDDEAVDRAEAWFLSAYRRAAGGSRA